MIDNTENVQYIDEGASTSDVYQYCENQLIPLYNHVIKYMCQEHIQSCSHINTIINASTQIRDKINKLSSSKSINKMMDRLEKVLESKYFSDAIIITVDEGIKGFTRPINKTEILKEFPLRIVLNADRVEKFLKDHAVNYETCKRFDLPELKKIPKATISAKNARILS